MRENDENVNWTSVLQFLQDEHRKFIIKSNDWELQKEYYEVELKVKKERIQEIEGKLLKSESINKDLLNRVCMLENSLLQERSKNSSNSLAAKEFKIQGILKDFKKNSKENKSISTPKESVEKVFKEFGFESLLLEIHSMREPTENLLPQIELATKPVEERETLYDGRKSSVYNELGELSRFKELYSLNSHLDSISSLAFMNFQNTLISVSEV